MNTAIIDDFEAACQRLTPLGRYIIGNACIPIRTAVLNFAHQNRTRVIEYESFQSWYTEQVEAGDWFFLDPLASIVARDTLRIRNVRASRVMRNGAWTVETDNMNIGDTIIGQSISLLDDVAISGSTLLQDAHLLLRAGAKSIKEISVCASLDHASAFLAANFPQARFRSFVQGSFACVHLRDSCPYFPFSGRPSILHPPVIVGSHHIHVRMPTIAIKGPGPWQAIFADSKVRHAVSNARTLVESELTLHLQRPARVKDLAQLGAEVVIPACSLRTVTAETELRIIT